LVGYRNVSKKNMATRRELLSKAVSMGESPKRVFSALNRLSDQNPGLAKYYNRDREWFSEQFL
jgi:hypothetical protein